MKEITLLDNDDVSREKFSKLNSTKIFSFDILSHKILKSKNIKHYMADELLNYEERKKIFDHVVTKLYWYKNQTFYKQSMINGISVFEFIDPLYLHQKLIITLTKFLIIKKIIETEKPEKIFTTYNLSRIITTIDNQIPLIYLNSEKVDVFDTFDIKLNLFSKIIPLKISMGKLKKFQTIFESIIGSIFGLWLNLKNKKPIILLLEFEPSKYSELLKNLNSEKSDCVILNRRKSSLLSYHSTNILKKHNIKLINLKKLLSKDQQKEISDLSIKYKKILKNLLNDDKKLNQIFTFENSPYFLCIKDFLKMQLDYEIEFQTENLVQSKYIFDNLDVKCILYGYESGTYETITLSQRKDIPSILIRHGFSSYTESLDELRWRYDQFRLLQLDCDQIILWGKADYNYYSKFIPNTKKLKIIGSPRHDIFFKKSVEMNNDYKLVLITVPPVIEWTGQQNVALELRYEQILKSIIHDLKKIPNVKIVGKLHPGWGWKFNDVLLKIFHQIDPQLPVYSTKPIIDLISKCNLMININPEENQPSTVILEGLIMKKPVINISLNEKNSEFDYDGISPIISLSYKANIIKYVNQLLTDSYFSDNLNIQIMKYLDYYLSNHKTASANLSEYLKSFI